MDLNNPQNQGYWFVLREDQSNVIFSTNNFSVQAPQITGQETRYIVDTGDNRQYVQVNDVVVTEPENTSASVAEDVKPISEDSFWDRNKIKLLLTLCLEERFKTISKDKYLWNEISAIVGASADECLKKFKNLRRIYIRLLKKRRLGKNIKWVHYDVCEEVFKDCKSLSPSALEAWPDNKVRRLLTLYTENIHRFQNRDCLQKDIWKEIAAALDTTEYNCYHKFKNLKRSYFNWREKSRLSGKLIKWPYHLYFERIFYDFNPCSGQWDKNKIKQLLDAYAQIAYKFKNPRFQKKELWKEISSIVRESPSDCDRKFRNLKQTYLRLKMRADMGGAVTKWRYYKDFEAIYHNLSSHSSLRVNKDGMPAIYKYQEEDYVKQLLTFFLENKEKFKDPFTKKKHVWRLIGNKIGLSSEECDRKFRNLKQTYLRLKEKKTEPGKCNKWPRNLKQTYLRLKEKKTEPGKCNKWPYYSYFEKIYEDPTMKGSSYSDDSDSVAMCEIRRVMRDIQDRHNGDKFDRLIQAMEESNKILRERNKILKALLDRR